MKYIKLKYFIPFPKPMGKITVNIPDDLERRLRIYLAKRYLGEKLHGKLSEVVATAIKEWLDRNVSREDEE